MPSDERYLCCMALLERAVSEAYGRAALSAEDPAVRAALEFISADSEKHARVLEALGSGARCTAEECAGLMGSAWRSEMEAAGRVSDLDSLLAEYDEMNRLECAAGEEYSAPVYLLAERLRERSGLASELLGMISEDEGRHARLLSRLRDELKGR